MLHSNGKSSHGGDATAEAPLALTPIGNVYSRPPLGALGVRNHCDPVRDCEQATASCPLVLVSLRCPRASSLARSLMPVLCACLCPDPLLRLPFFLRFSPTRAVPSSSSHPPPASPRSLSPVLVVMPAASAVIDAAADAVVPDADADADVPAGAGGTADVDATVGASGTVAAVDTADAAACAVVAAAVSAVS